MTHSAGNNAPLLLFAGYIMCFIALNAVVFLISLFYRRKLLQPAPRWGFITAIILSCFYLLFGLGPGRFSQGFWLAGMVFLGISAITSAFSGLRLFVIMRKVHK